MDSTSTATAWVRSWDRQQERYMADREERFQVIADVVEATVDRPDPLVVDLGCGPGSLGARILDRLPGARVVGADSDPVLLGLAAGAYGDRENLRVVDTDLRTVGWTAALRLDRPADAVVSTTALHWLHTDELGRLYRDVADLLRPGGVFADGDHVFAGPERPGLDALGRAVRAARAVRAGVEQDAEAWKRWWDEIEADPELADLVAERGRRPLDHNMGSDGYYDVRMRLLAEAGFAEAGTIWQCGDDRVLVALR